MVVGVCKLNKVSVIDYLEFFSCVMARVEPSRLSFVISVSLLSNFNSALSTSVLLMDTFSVVSFDVLKNIWSEKNEQIRVYKNLKLIKINEDSIRQLQGHDF